MTLLSRYLLCRLLNASILQEGFNFFDDIDNNISDELLFNFIELFI